MKKTLLAAALVAAAASAQADTKLYGHVSYNVATGDQVNENYEFQRHAFSETRFGFNFSKKVGGIKALALQEFGIAEGEGALDSRRQAFGFSGAFGKVLLGQYNDVGDGVLHADLAGTGLVDPMSSSSAGAVRGLPGVSVNGFDPGRGEALRYYTPKLGGVITLAAQVETNKAYELAWKLNASGFRFYGFYADKGDEDNEDATVTVDYESGILIGYKAPFGFSVTYSGSVQEPITGDAISHGALKFGYGIGKHKVSLKFQARDDGTATDPNAEETSLAYLYNMAKGVQLWAHYKEAESDTVDTQSGFAVGGRIKF